jgi:hypothetical protein
VFSIVKSCGKGLKGELPSASIAVTVPAAASAAIWPRSMAVHVPKMCF